MVAGGSCIARIDGKAVFVPYSLPGETVEIEITDNRKDFAFSRLVGVVEPSPRRVTPVCPLFGLCGGCTLQMADDEYQKELRLSILKDIFSRAHIAPRDGVRLESGEPLGYRSRFQFHRASDGAIGLKEGAGNEVIKIEDCPVAVPEIREALRNGTLAESARKFNEGDRFHVFAHGGKLWQEGGDTSCEVEISGIPLRFDVRGFFQSNIPMLERLIGTVCGNASGKRLLDFYSGIGTFSAFAGTHFSGTVLVEHNREAIELARENLASLGSAAVFRAVSDERWPSDRSARLEYDLAIIDPPRQGISKNAIAWFMESGIPEIRYVSCDPVTFARDAAKLISSGYVFREAVLFDFYPQTHHIETLGFFTK